MKILGVKFLNLNSLKGEHAIRFDENPLAGAGLFTITGQTGAGKTTLLDAITVALYGRVHRHDRSAFEMMTRHTGESFAEVDFEVKGQRYRSKWSVYRSRKKPNGTLQPIHMELFQVTEKKFFDLKPSQVPDKVAEISGLDYNQFLRSVMLSQGDFTRFLKATENERSELLEKITDTEIFSQISRFVYQKERAEHQQLTQLQSKLQDVKLLSAEEQATYETRLQELLAQERAHRHSQLSLAEKLTWLQTLRKLEAKKLDLATQLAALQLERKNRQPQFEQLQRHQQAVVHKPALAEIKSAKSHWEAIVGELQKLETELPVFQQEASEAALQLKQARLWADNAQTQLNEAEPVLAEIIRMDSVIGSNRQHFLQNQQAMALLNGEAAKTKEQAGLKAQELRRIEEKTEKLSVWLIAHQHEGCLEKEMYLFQRYRTDLADVYRQIAGQTAEIKKYSAEIKDGTALHQRLLQDTQTLRLQEAGTQTCIKELQQQKLTQMGGQALDELEKACNALPGLISRCEQQTQLAERYVLKQKKTQELARQAEELQTDLQAAEASLTGLQEKKKEAEAHLQDLQHLVELQLRIQKYEADRGSLQPGLECPLCGSKEHPFVLHAYHSHVSEAEQKRNTQQQFVHRLTEQLNLHADQASTLRSNFQSTQKQKAEMEQEARQMALQFEENNKTLPKPLDMEKLPVIQAVTEKKKQTFELLRQKIHKIRSLEQQLQQSESASHRQGQALLRTENQAEQFAEKIKHAQSFLNRAQIELQDLQEQETNLHDEAQSFVMRFDLTFDYAKSAALEAGLQLRAQTFSENQQSLHTLRLERQERVTDLKKTNEALEEKRIALQERQAALQAEEKQLREREEERFNLFGEKDPGMERERLKKELQQKMARVETLRQQVQEKQERLRISQEQRNCKRDEKSHLQSKHAALTQQLEANIHLQGIRSIEALVALYLSDEEEKRLSNLQRQFDHDLAACTRLLQETEAEWEREKERKLTGEDEACLSRHIQETENFISELNREIGGLAQQLRRNQELRTHYSALSAQIERQQKEQQRWQELSHLIGSESGKKFSRFAQGLTLTRLTELANLHLQKLNDRYRILKSPNQDLELLIIDVYQADAIRPMTTLSGGESFLVSLALALGLSDLAGRKAQINSLFIDEGFGTLDADALEMALSCLENLQADGKMICIISHVEALKERIPTQIQVHRLAGGISRIEVVGYSISE